MLPRQADRDFGLATWPRSLGYSDSICAQSVRATAWRMATDPRGLDEADVYKKDRLAGKLRRTPEAVEFQYLDEYLEDQPEAIANTLQPTTRPVVATGGSVPPFFAGLLPEGLRLTALTRRLKTSADDMFSLLVAVGADTIGDVRVFPAGAEATDPTPTRQIANWDEADFDELFGLSTGSNTDWTEAAALPGVQVKVSSEMISFPVAGAVGDRSILKLNPPNYPHLIENEAFFMAMARASGLDVPHFELVTDRRRRTGLLVKRFDRALRGTTIVRLYQEDACQLLGRYPADKYRLTFAEVSHSIMAASTVATIDGLGLVRLGAFSYLIGNGDLHAKNISVSETIEGDVRLSPTYDVLSTIAYVGDDHLALPIDGRDNKLRRRHFTEFGLRLGVPERATARAIDRICELAPSWIERLSEIGLDDRRTHFVEAELRRRGDALAEARPTT